MSPFSGRSTVGSTVDTPSGSVIVTDTGPLAADGAAVTATRPPTVATATAALVTILIVMSLLRRAAGARPDPAARHPVVAVGEPSPGGVGIRSSPLYTGRRSRVPFLPRPGAPVPGAPGNPRSRIGGRR